jgi:tricorn protease
LPTGSTCGKRQWKATQVSGHGPDGRASQVDKRAAIIDEHNDGGGDTANYIINDLRCPLLNYWNMRECEDVTSPFEAIFGPKVMITNKMDGSGGDALPCVFRKTGIGPLIGKRTWGGLVSH